MLSENESNGTSSFEPASYTSAQNEKNKGPFCILALHRTLVQQSCGSVLCTVGIQICELTAERTCLDSILSLAVVRNNDGCSVLTKIVGHPSGSVESPCFQHDQHLKCLRRRHALASRFWYRFFYISVYKSVQSGMANIRSSIFGCVGSKANLRFGYIFKYYPNM